MPRLEIHNLVTGYGDLRVLDRTSMSVDSGSVTALLGPNGAGKSTLLSCVSGLSRAWSGNVLIDGEDISRTTIIERLARGIALVPQGRDLFGPLTVAENLELGAYGGRLSGAASAARLAEILDLFPILSEKLQLRAETLSGGQQQMLAIGRALMSGPSFLLLDEPSQGLGPLVVEAVLQSLKQLAGSGTGIVLAEQDGAAGLKVADRCYVMRAGAVVWDGTKQEAEGAGLLRDLYFGSRDGAGSR